MRALLMLLLALAGPAAHADWRDVANGLPIHEHGYCDQPYVVQLEDGAWLCVFTTNSGHEGTPSQFVVATRSTDRGESWSEPVPIEPPDGPEASWAVPLVTDFGRVYAFYTFNGDDIHQHPDDGREIRADMLGWHAFRYSDDGGRSWSERHRLPMRVTAADRGNDWGGGVQIFWGIDKPVAVDGTVYFGFTKLGRYMLDEGEGWFWRSGNILTERDPERIDWELLPDGEHGIRHPEYGSIQEEHNAVPLSDGSLYCVYRTTLGFIAETISTDGGRSWSEPQPVRYASGAVIKNPRACPRLWRTESGRYLLWFHNHGGTDFRDRNPAWITGGMERNGRIAWSEPEVLLYSDDLSYDTGRLSYPDLIEEDGRVWITVTQKTAATVHEVDASLLEGLWNPPSTPEPIAVLEPGTGDTIAMPALPSLQGGGFSIHMELQAGDIGPGDVLFAARSDAGPRIAIAGTEGGAISVIMSDGEVDLEWTSAPGAIGDAITLTFDGGPNVITLVKDGILCDGGDTHREGWGRFSPELGAVMPRETPARFHPAVTRFSVFDRALRTAEAIALFHGNGVQVVSTGSLSHRDRIARVRSEVTKGLVTYASKAAAPSSFGRNPSE